MVQAGIREAINTNTIQHQLSVVEVVAAIDHQANQVNQAPVNQARDNLALVNMAKEINMAAHFNIHMDIQVNNNFFYCC